MTYHSCVIRPKGSLVEKSLHHRLSVEKTIFVTGIDDIIVDSFGG